jgi:hypothetical protein
MAGYTVEAQEKNPPLKASFDYYSSVGTNSHEQDLLFIVRSSIDKELLGNPFLNSWEEAFVLTKAGKVFKIQSRYRIFDDEFQVKVGNQVKAIYPEAVEGIVFKDRVFVTRNCKHPEGIKLCFLELLSEGSMNLFKRHMLVTKSTKSSIKIVGSKTQLLYANDNDVAYLLPTNSNEIMDLLLPKKKEIKQLITKNNLSTTKESDLVQIFDYYNELSE